MISELTQEQENLLDVYADKWIGIGLCTKETNKEKAEKLVHDLYKAINLSPPKRIIWARSPIEMLKLASEAKGKKTTDYSEEWSECNSWGQHDASRRGSLEYYKEVLGLHDIIDPCLPLIELSKETGWHLFYENLAILCEKPELVKVDAQGRLHNTNGPSIKYRDGIEYYDVEGVSINDKSTYDAIFFGNDPLKVLQIKNADIQALGIKYFGIDRMLEHLPNDIIDVQPLSVITNGISEIQGEALTKACKEFSKSNVMQNTLRTEYALIAIDLFKDGRGKTNKLLRMKNPSEPKVHFEFVSPDCTSVVEAIAFREGLSSPKELNFVVQV